MRIAFWGNFGTRNFGNECTLAAILYNIRKRVPDAELVSVSVVPEDTADRHGINAIAMWGGRPRDPANGLVAAIRRAIHPLTEWARTLRLSRGLDAIIVPGTGILNDIGQSPFGFPYNLFKWALATRLCGGRVFFVSVGAERIDHTLSRLFINSALRLAEFRSFRDSRSLERMRATGFRGAGDIYPDLAFSSQERAPVAHERRARGRVVALGVCNYRDLSRHGVAAIPYETYVDQIGSMIVWLIERGYDVRLIIGDVRDMAVRADLRAWLRGRGFDPAQPSYNDHPATSFGQVMDQLAAVDLVIASRFHNIILAMFLGRPAIALSYEGKIEALMQDMGFGDYCQILAQFDLGRLIEQFQRLERNAPLLCSALAQRVQAKREQLDRQYDLLVANLGTSSYPSTAAGHSSY